MYKCLVTLSDRSDKDITFEAERKYLDFKFDVYDYKDLFKRIENTIKSKPFLEVRHVQATYFKE